MILSEDIRNFGEIYHITKVDNILSILETDVINLSISLSVDKFGKKFYYLSLSRTPSVNIGYRAGNVECRIVFDLDKLRNKFHIKSYDYFKQKALKRDWKPNQFEFEDRLMSNMSNIAGISKYIKRIEIVYNNPFKDREYTKKIQRIIVLSKTRGIQLDIYKNDNDFRLGRNKINFNEIINIDTSQEEIKKNSYFWVDESIDKIISVIMFDRKYLDDYDLFKEDLNILLQQNGLTINDIKSEYDIFKNMEYLTYGTPFVNNVGNELDRELHQYHKSGKGGIFRILVEKLVKLMVRSGARTIVEYLNLKVFGIKPQNKKIDYSKTWGLKRLEYNYDTYEYDTWESISNESKLENLSGIYFNSYDYGGSLSKEDMYKYFDLEKNNGSIGEFLNYLMNKYTIDFVKRIVYNSGYGSFDKRHYYKLEKL